MSKELQFFFDDEDEFTPFASSEDHEDHAHTSTLPRGITDDAGDQSDFDSDDESADQGTAVASSNGRSILISSAPSATHVPTHHRKYKDSYIGVTVFSRSPSSEPTVRHHYVGSPGQTYKHHSFLAERGERKDWSLPIAEAKKMEQQAAQPSALKPTVEGGSDQTDSHDDFGQVPKVCKKY